MCTLLALLAAFAQLCECGCALRPARCAALSQGRVVLTASIDAALVWSVKDWSRLRALGAGAGIVQVCTRMWSHEALCNAVHTHT